MIANNTRVHFNGLKVQPSDTREFKILWMILQALNTNASIVSRPSYNTVSQSDLLSEDTITYSANTVHSISFSVILGTAVVSFDGGDTSVTYPIGSNINIEAVTTFNQDIIITVSGTSGDGLNRLTVNTTTL